MTCKNALVPDHAIQPPDRASRRLPWRPRSAPLLRPRHEVATRSTLRPLLGASLAILAFSGCRMQPTVRSLFDVVVIDSTARALMQREHVQGLTLAVIDRGRIIHVAAYGIRNAARDPLTTQTIMYGASLTAGRRALGWRCVGRPLADVAVRALALNLGFCLCDARGPVDHDLLHRNRFGPAGG